MGPRLRLVLVCMCLLFAPGITGRAQPIGELMKPDRMVIRGATAFAPEQIRNGLYRNQEFGLAAKPTMPATEYLELVRRQLLAGYSRSGYGQSQITVTVDQEENAHRVIVDIQEGPLAVCGPVRVTGVPEEKTAVICRSLAGEQGTPESAERREGIGDEGSFVEFEEVGTEPRPDDPFWPAGTPANLHESGQRKIRQRVQAILSDEGFGGAEVESRCELEGQQAVLHVQVCGLTDPAVIAELQVTGNDRDTDQEVLQYLGLQIGQPWTVHEQYRVLRSLWMSARFRETRLRAEMAADGAHVMIDVRDYGAAPKLTGEFSREEAALLKLREWLVSGEGKSKDFVWQSDFKNFLLNCIVSARHGMLVEFAAGRDEEARQRSKHIVYFGPQELRIYAYSNQSRFTQAGWGLMLTFLLRTTRSAKTPRLSSPGNSTPRTDSNRPSRAAGRGSSAWPWTCPPCISSPWRTKRQSARSGTAMNSRS